MTADVRQLDALAADLATSHAEILQAETPVVAKGALNIKNAAKNLASAIGPHAKLYPGSISYDIATTATTVIAEIGPDKDRPQGPLGNILEFGTSNNPPHPHLGPSLDAEAQPFTDHVQQVAADRLLR